MAFLCTIQANVHLQMPKINKALLLKGNAKLADIHSGGLLHVVNGKTEARPRQLKEKIISTEQ